MESNKNDLTSQLSASATARITSDTCFMRVKRGKKHRNLFIKLSVGGVWLLLLYALTLALFWFYVHISCGTFILMLLWSHPSASVFLLLHFKVFRIEYEEKSMLWPRKWLLKFIIVHCLPVFCYLKPLSSAFSHRKQVFPYFSILNVCTIW